MEGEREAGRENGGGADKRVEGGGSVGEGGDMRGITSIT